MPVLQQTFDDPRHARLNHLRQVDQPYVMPQRQQLTAEMMRTNAGLHADQAGGNVRKARLNLSP